VGTWPQLSFVKETMTGIIIGRAQGKLIPTVKARARGNGCWRGGGTIAVALESGGKEEKQSRLLGLAQREDDHGQRLWVHSGECNLMVASESPSPESVSDIGTRAGCVAGQCCAKENEGTSIEDGPLEMRTRG